MVSVLLVFVKGFSFLPAERSNLLILWRQVITLTLTPDPSPLTLTLTPHPHPHLGSSLEVEMSEGEEVVHGATAAPAASKKSAEAPSKYAPLSKLAKKDSTGPLLRAAQQRASELNAALAKLERQTPQYLAQRELKREAKGLADVLLKERNQLVRLLKSAAKELDTALDRLQPFDDAAAKLKEAGMRNIPHLYATGVTQGKIHPQCFFNTFI